MFGTIRSSARWTALRHREAAEPAAVGVVLVLVLLFWDLEHFELCARRL